MSLHDEILNQGKNCLLERFAAPGVAFRGKPFWSWNGELEKEELIRQVGVLKEMGMGGYFMHSRAGLITEYLGEEWFELINAVADAGEQVGLEAWLYDEDRWPSGSAGGKVTVDPQYRMKSLCLQEQRLEEFVWSEDVYLAFLAKTEDHNLYYYSLLSSGCDVLEKQKQAADGPAAAFPGEWKVLRFMIVPEACSSGYNGTTYIDTMSRKATDKFIELTHEAYAKHCGDRLGRSIKGIFTDEPHRGQGMNDLSVRDGLMRCSIAWTDDLFEEFRKRYGYDAVPILPELFYWPEGRRVAPIKLHYFDLTDNLFLERFAIPIQEWCTDHGIEFTGHVLHEDSLSNQTAPHGSLMRFYEHMGYPGIDVLSEGNRGYWIVKQLASAARQLGKKWLLSELYGCTGWQFHFKSHKTVGDWQALFGINVRCQHLSWYTMEGEAKRDYPASILHQSPWYPDYDLVESYFGRFGVVMTEGRQACDVLVLNAIESVWCQTYAGWARWIVSADPEVDRLEAHYVRLFHMLAENQIDFDYGEEEMMSRMASVEKAPDGSGVFLRVGKALYRTVVVSGMLTVRATTVQLLRDFLDLGGCVLFSGPVPAYVDALPSTAPEELSNHPQAQRLAFEENELIPAVRQQISCPVRVRRLEDGQTVRSVFCQTRICEEDGVRFVVLLNTDREEGTGPVEIETIGLSCSAVELWDLKTGERFDASSLTVREDNRLILRTSFLAAESKVFAFVEQQEYSLPPVQRETTVRTAEVTGPVSYRLDEENICVLDYAKWKWEDGPWQEEQEILKVDVAVRDRLGLEHRGGGMLQPWYAKNFDTKEYGTLELEYEFYVDRIPEGPVTVAGERPEYNEYRLNGVLLSSPGPDCFWVDSCFKRMPVPTGTLRVGRNVVTVKTTFKRTSNLEALYLLGHFGVALEDRKRTLTGLPEQIGFDSLPAVGLPFYSGQITYRISSEMLTAAGVEWRPDESIYLSPISFGGALVKVARAGSPSETRKTGWEPYEIDVTDFLSEGSGLDVTLVLTRRNTFGPLHQYPKIQPGYGPESFMTTGEAWRDSYMLLETGILGGIRFLVRKKENF